MEKHMLSDGQVRLIPLHHGIIRRVAIATLPLFAVLIYLLYEAAIRPNQPIYKVEGDDDAVIEEAWEQTPPLVPLFDMVVVFLIIEGIFMLLWAYTIIFIPRRRRMMQSYLEMGESSLGDVMIDESNKCCRNRVIYGYVEYVHPDSHDPVRKQVRLYQPHARERVTILRIQDRPFSGQPKADVIIDILASEAARPQITQLMWLSLAWLVFTTVLAPPFLLYQMKQLRPLDPYEDVSLAMTLYIIIGVILIPATVLVGMCLRWALYRHWVVNRGMLLNHGDREDVSTTSVFLSELTGKTNPKEINTDSDETSVTISSADQTATVSFVRM